MPLFTYEGHEIGLDRGRPYRLARLPTGLDEVDDFLREPKVAELELPVLVDENVGWLHITVDDSLGVHVHQPRDEILTKAPDDILG